MFVCFVILKQRIEQNKQFEQRAKTDKAQRKGKFEQTGWEHEILSLR